MSDNQEGINPQTIKDLEDKIWSYVKNGYQCPNCQTSLKPRFAFGQWKKNYRILCKHCEFTTQLKEGKKYAEVKN